MLSMLVRLGKEVPLKGRRRENQFLLSMTHTLSGCQDRPSIKIEICVLEDFHGSKRSLALAILPVVLRTYSGRVKFEDIKLDHPGQRGRPISSWP